MADLIKGMRDPSLPQTVAVGELSAAFLGTNLKLTRQSGHVTTIIEDTLTEVRHRSDAQTTLFFKGTQWVPVSLLGGATDTGVTVGSDHRVEVIEAGAPR